MTSKVSVRELEMSGVIWRIMMVASLKILGKVFGR